jgi:hypothetical protein
MGTTTPTLQQLLDDHSAPRGGLVSGKWLADAGDQHLSKLKRSDGSNLVATTDALISAGKMRRDEFGISFHCSGREQKLLGGDQLMRWEADALVVSDSDEELSPAAAEQANDSEEDWCCFENMVSSRVRSGKGKPAVVSNSEGDEPLDEEEEQEAEESAERVTRRRERLDRVMRKERRAADRSRKKRSLQLIRGKQMMLLEQPKQQLQALAAHKHVVTTAAQGKHAADDRCVRICKKASLANPSVTTGHSHCSGSRKVALHGGQAASARGAATQPKDVVITTAQQAMELVCLNCWGIRCGGVCTSCGVSQFFRDGICSVDGCEQVLWAHDPACECSRGTSRCFDHIQQACTKCCSEPEEEAAEQLGDANWSLGGVTKGVAVERLKRLVKEKKLGRQKKHLVSSWPLHQQRAWAAGVLATDAPAEQQHAWWILREWDAERETCITAHREAERAAVTTGPVNLPEEAWWRGLKVNREEAELALFSLLKRCKSGAEVLEAWHGDGCPSNVVWRRMVRQGRMLDQRSTGAVKHKPWHTLAGSRSIESLLGAGVWEPTQRTPVWKTTLKLQAGKLRQLVQWDVLLRKYSNTAVIGSATAKELGVPLVDGGRHALLTVEVDGNVCLWRAEVDNESVDGIAAPFHFAQSWEQLITKAPGKSGSNLSWSNDVQRLEVPTEGDVAQWWSEQSEEALKECSSPVLGEAGALFETDDTTPDDGVLGPWVLEAFKQAGSKLAVVARSEMTCEQNPPWAMKKHDQQVFKAGKLHDHLQDWIEFGADAEVLSWIKDMVPLHVDEAHAAVIAEELGYSHVGIKKPNGKRAQENLEDLRSVVLDVLQAGSWEVVTEDGIQNSLPLNLVPKPGKDPPWRLILNGMPFNPFVPLWSVRYETLRTVPMVVEKDDWVFNIDFTNAYYQIFFQKVARSLLGATVEFTQEQVRHLRDAGLLPDNLEWDEAAEFVEVCVRPRGLAMGYRNSCAIWTKLARVITKRWREKGFKIVHLIDDVLVSVTGSYEQACAVRDEMLADLERLGIQVNWKKSVLTPSKCVRFLGMLVDSAAYRFFVPPDKVEKLRDLINDMVGSGAAAVRALASVTGKIMSMQIAVPAVRMMTAECYKLIRPDGDWDRSIKLTDAVVKELLEVLQWISFFNSVGNPIKRYVGMREVRILVDAGTGFGWRLDGVSRSHEFGAHVRAAAGDWDADEAALWQPWKELMAVEKCLLAEGDSLRGALVLLRPDATTTVRYINKGSGPSAKLTAVMRRIWSLCVRYGIGLHAEHLSGDRMVGCGVDSLSRLSEFSVSPKVFRLISNKSGFGVRSGFGGYTLDLYASQKTAKCRKYAELGGGGNSVGDARTLKLRSNENYWVVPPIAVVHMAVMMVLEAGITATIVVPNWPNRPWHVLLRKHARAFTHLRWHESRPVMWDVCVKSKKHVHLVDKWDFVAFAVGGVERTEVDSVTWEPRKQRAATGKKRRRALWSDAAIRKAADMKRLKLQLRGGAPVKQRTLRVLSLCDGCSAASLALRQLTKTTGILFEVTVVEWDEVCQSLVAVRFPEAVRGWSQDVVDWASPAFKPELFGDTFSFDLVIAGYPCQDLSSAFKAGQGLAGGRSSLFFDIWCVICKLRRVNKEMDFVLECVDFEKKHKSDFALVSAITNVTPVKLCASMISACFRKRVFWCSFDVLPLLQQDVWPAEVLEPGRWTSDRWLPTIMASGTYSWNTAAVVFDESVGVEFGKLPLRTVEMERAMDMPDNFTAIPGISERQRHHMVGNSFHVGVIRHVLRWWTLHLQAWDSTLGYPGEGPDVKNFYSRLDEAPVQHVVERSKTATQVQQPCDLDLRLTTGGKRKRNDFYARLSDEPQCQEATRQHSRQPSTVLLSSAAPAPSVSGRTAAWRAALPDAQQTCEGLDLGGIWNVNGWGNTDRLLLDKRATKKKMPAINGTSGFRIWLKELQHDLILSSRSDATWKAYRAWVQVFAAWCAVFGVSITPTKDLWQDWVEVLSAAVAVLSLCYSVGTLQVFTSAVSAFMQDAGMPSPFQSKYFSLLMSGVTRWLGVGKHKKPPVEAWHVAEIMELAKTDRFTQLQLRQAKAMLLVGWHLFNRPQDFNTFQVCDFVRLEHGMRVYVRYAKNDQKGLTRCPILEEASNERDCPVENLLSYFRLAGLSVQPGCTKVPGEPDACTVCPPAFPSIHKHKGVQNYPMPTQRVSEIVKKLFLSLADIGKMSADDAKQFSGKSCRCGGVSAAAGNEVRDGVVQGHGGWLMRESLVHYDRITDKEAPFVSRALNGAVAKLRCLSGG